MPLWNAESQRRQRCSIIWEIIHKEATASIIQRHRLKVPGPVVPVLEARGDFPWLFPIARPQDFCTTSELDFLAF